MTNGFYPVNEHTINDFLLEVAKGNVPGHSLVTTRGRNLDVDLSASEDIWGAGGTLVYPTAGETWEIVSSDAADTGAGTGLQSVDVKYLDDAYVEQTESKTLSGITPVVFTATDAYRHINILPTAAGSTGSNVGLITLRPSGGGNDRAAIPATKNTPLDGHYTIPAGKTGYITYAIGTLGKGRDADVTLQSTTGDDGMFVERFPVDLYQNTAQIQPTAPVGPFLEKTDFRPICTTLNNNTTVSFSYQILLVDN